jgi:glucose-6-phosphate-specific signal transduction histidine kinase
VIWAVLYYNQLIVHTAYLFHTGSHHRSTWRKLVMFYQTTSILNVSSILTRYNQAVQPLCISYTYNILLAPVMSILQTMSHTHIRSTLQGMRNHQEALSRNTHLISRDSIDKALWLRDHSTRIIQDNITTTKMRIGDQWDGWQAIRHMHNF